jgi:pimeloyl-ACP methyl ester carboxylesterase
VGLDLPAHGDTSEGETDGLELAEALNHAARELGNVHGIVAHSMGSVATTLALQDGLSVGSVVFISPAVRLERGLAHFVDMYSLPQRAGRGLRAEIERRYGETIWDDIAVDRIARDLNVPALIVHDLKDTQVSVEDAQMLAAAWPSAQQLLTLGLGHNRILRDPGVIGRAVAFLEERSLVPA